MRNTLTLEDLSRREVAAINAFALRELILATAKHEAYDDSGIDVSYVAQMEKECPGIITAYSGDHCFSSATPEENRRVVMEAVNSGMIKASLLGAVILLIYKVYRVLTNNKAFSSGGGGGGGGGRGSATFNKNKNEEIRDKAKNALVVYEQVKDKAQVAQQNALNREDDSKVYRAAERFNETLALPSTQVTKNVDPFKEIQSKNFDILAEIAMKAPSFLFAKKDEDFKGLVEFYSLFLALASGEGHRALNFRVVNNSIAETLVKINSAKPEQAVQLVQSEDGLNAYTKVYIDFIGQPFVEAKLLEPSAIADGVFSLRTALAPIIAEFTKMISPGMDVTDTEFMSKEEILKDLLDDYQDRGTSKILDRIEAIGKFNDAFREFTEAFDSEFDRAGESSLREDIMQFCQKSIEEAKESEELSPEQKRVVLRGLREAQAIYEMVQIQILGSLFKYRMATDKFNKLQDDLLTAFVDIEHAGMNFITVIEKSED